MEALTLMLFLHSAELFRLPKTRNTPPYLIYFIKISDVDAWRSRKGALHQRPADFDPSRYVSFSTKEVVEDPVAQEHIHEYVERSRLSRRLGW